TSRYGVNGVSRSEQDITRTLYLQADVFHYKPWDFFFRHSIEESSNRRELQQVIERSKPDLVLVWGMWNLSLNLPFWAEQWLLGRVAYFIASYWPVDTNIHTEYWELPARRALTELAKRPLRALALAKLRREGYPPKLRFEHVRCCSHYVRNAVTRDGGVPSSAGVLFGGIGPEPFLKNPVAQNAGDDPLRLLYFGSLIPHKGVHTAIEALGLLKERDLIDRVDLTILGSGPPEYESRLRTMVLELGIDDQVHFVGRVPRDEIPVWLSRFDVFLFTSIWQEPMARSVMEAMASGLLVIGSEVGGQVEMLFDGENGLTFRPEDAVGLADRIAQAIHNPDLRQALAHAGQQTTLEQFTLNRMAEDMEAWLHGIVTAIS
ncbi:MAG: glycosyltransferase family 4 protein, partial [Anaerolineae bacterium]|nr:glycosyltransferase family 4 protein [Anaerolineae bacterium]